MAYTLDAGPDRVTVRSTRPLPLEPTKAWHRELRDELRSALAQLEPGPALVATWWSRDPSADAENVLLYNVGTGSFSALARDRLVIVMRDERPEADSEPWPEVMSYTTSAPPPRTYDGASMRLRLRRLTTSTKAVEVWQAAHEGSIETAQAAGAGRLAMGIRLHRRDGSHGRNLASVVKPLVDGVLSALHQLPESALHLADRLVGTDVHEARRWLEADGWLGPHPFLLPHGQGVQWSPADDRLARIDLSHVEADRDDVLIEVELAALTG